MRNIAAMLVLALAASPALADNAVPRGGGGGGSSSAGASHGSGGSSSSGGGGGGGSSSSSGGSASTAERRHPRAGTGTGGRYGRSYPSYGGYYGGYAPWYPWYYPADYAYGPYWGAYYYGYWPYGAYYSGGGYYPSSRAYGSSDRTYRGGADTGAVRIMVDPDDAKVYVDGYYAGKVDDFDGVFQRLTLTEGRHEVLLKRDGYRTQSYRIYVRAGTTIKIEHDMVKGAGDEPLQDLTGGRGADDPDRSVSAAPRGAPRPEEWADEPAPRPRRSRDDDAVDVRPERADRTGYLRLDVQPSDASIYVDGEFRGTARQITSLELGGGAHRVEIVRPGFRTEQREVVVDPGQTRDLEIELARP